MQLTKQWKYLAVLEYIRLYIIMGVTCFFGMRKWHSFEILFEWFILLWNECFLDLSLFPLIRRNTVSKHWIIVGRGFLTPLFYKDPPSPPPPYCLPAFSNFVQLPPPSSTALFVALSLWLNEWSRHICVTLLNEWYYRPPKHFAPWHFSTSSPLLCFLYNKASDLLKVCLWWHGFC